MARHWMKFALLPVLLAAACRQEGAPQTEPDPVATEDQAPADPRLSEPGDNHLKEAVTSSGIRKGHTGAKNGDGDFCDDAANKCTWGEGDCDADSQCFDPRGASKCGTDNGPRFGFVQAIDVCVPATCFNGTKDGTETDVDCGGECGSCEPVCDNVNGAADKCSQGCPCDIGEGDCDSASECRDSKTGLVTCVADVGARFGMSADTDVCLPSWCNNGRQDADKGETGLDCGGLCGPCASGCGSTCTVSCPCTTGGHCHSSLECQQGSVCAGPSSSKVCTSVSPIAISSAAESSTASVLGAAAAASNAIDGNTGTYAQTDTTDTNSRLQVDLGSAQAISQVVITNVDVASLASRSRLRDITVTVLNGLGGAGDFSAGTVVFKSSLQNAENAMGGGVAEAGPNSLVVDVPNRVGRFIRITRTPDPDLSGTNGGGTTDEVGSLSVAEVQVYGP